MTTITTSDTARDALYTKVNTMVGECVKNTGNETIAGTKTFSTSPVVPTATSTDNSKKAASTAFVKTAISGKANDSSVVHLTGNETIAGTKTFSTSPVIPTATSTDNSTKAASTAFVKTAISSKADDSSVVHLTGNEIIAGTKTFSTSPIVPTPAVSSNTNVPATTAYINAKFLVVTELPATPDSNTFYFVKE